MMVPRHNPAGEAAEKICAVLTSYYHTQKRAAVYFDGRHFTSNANRLGDGELPTAAMLGIEEMVEAIDYDHHGMVRLTPSEVWVKDCIESWPEHDVEGGDEVVEGFIQRLSAHLAFGFVVEEWHEDAYLLSLRLLRLNHVSSDAIREDIRAQIILDYDRMVRECWMPEELVLAILYGI